MKRYYMFSDEIPCDTLDSLLHTHHLKNGAQIQLCQRKELGIPFQLWTGAIVLSDYFERNTHLVQGAVVLELGAGIGLLGLILAKLGAHHVTMTDISAALPLLQRNICANDAESCCCASELDWFSCVSGGQLPSSVVSIQRTMEELPSAPLVLVGSDLVYWESLFDPLISTLRLLFSVFPASTLYLGQCTRRRKNEGKFFKMISRIFRCSKLSECKVDSEKHPCRVFQIQSR